MPNNAEQRIRNVIRVANAQRWDLRSQEDSADGVYLVFSPAGQLSDPAVLPAAITQLGYALAPFLARMTEYISPKAGGPTLKFFIPKTPTIISAPQ
jgi:hypothetical protein